MCGAWGWGAGERGSRRRRQRRGHPPGVCADTPRLGMHAIEMHRCKPLLCQKCTGPGVIPHHHHHAIFTHKRQAAANTGE
jgi:hypothetical protein